MGASFRFVVTATKAGKSIVMNCMSSEGVASIESLAVTAEDIETIQSNGGIDTKQYQGPEFIELDEDLQRAFHDYLETDLGVNGDLASFICMYADYKEQAQYVQFLKDAKNIIS